MFKNILCMSALAAIVAPAFAAEWMTDFEAAKAKAAQENKALLVDFTGSDWCGYCIQLRKAVLDTPAFEQYAADKFVLVEVDLPRRKQLDPALLAQNQQLCEKYGIQGFPTVLVMTPEGTVIGGFSGFLPNMEAVQAPLDAALATNALLQQAAAAEGDEKAKLLYAAYMSLPEDLRDSSGLLEVVAAADPNNVTGIQDIAADQIQAREIEAKLRAVADDPEKLIEVIQQEMETATPNNKKRLQELLEAIQGIMLMQELESAFMESPAKALAVVEAKIQNADPSQLPMLLSMKFELQLITAETVEDIAAAKATALQLMELLPDEEKAELAEIIETEFADPAALLEKIKTQRALMEEDEDEDEE